MILTLIAEVLAGETRITPGGAVDAETAFGLDACLWDRSTLERAEAAEPAAEALEPELALEGAAAR